MSPEIINIEGIVAAGKTTLLQQLKKDLADRNDILFVDEPLINIETFKTYKPLELLEKDPKTYACAFQLHVINVLNEYYSKLVIPRRTKYIITDRFFTSPLIFVDAMHGVINDFEKDVLICAVNQLVERFSRIFPEKNRRVFYINVTPAEARVRVLIRGRIGEQRHVNNEYLRRLEHAYLKHYAVNSCTVVCSTKDSVLELSDEFIQHFIKN